MNAVQTAMIILMLPIINFVFSLIFLAMIMYENKCPDDTGRMTTGFYIFFMILTALHLAIFGAAMNKYLKDKNKPENQPKMKISSIISITITSLICILSVYYGNKYCRDTLFWTVIIFPIIIFFIGYFLFIKLYGDITSLYN